VSWTDLVKYSDREVASKIQQTGFCSRCKQKVRKYTKCPLSLPSPSTGVKPDCPMRVEKT
jgi:hypothetical protein